jgi:hypothetical protein
MHTSRRTPLKEWSALCRHCYLHNTQQTPERTCVPSVGSKTTIQAIHQCQTYILNSAATQIKLCLLPQD